MKHVPRPTSQLQTSRHRKTRISDLKDYEKQFTELKRVKKQHTDWEEMDQKVSFQSAVFRNKSVKSWAQGKLRSESKARNSKTNDKRQSLRLRNIYSVWLWKKRANGNEGVKICLKHWWNESIMNFRIVFWTDCYCFRKNLLLCRRKSDQILILSLMYYEGYEKFPQKTRTFRNLQ